MTERLSVPGVGRTIQSATEERAKHVRKAVQLIEPTLRSGQVDADMARMFAPRWDGGATAPTIESASSRAAWALVNIWLLARMGKSGRVAGFAEAEDWFVGGLRSSLPSLAAHVPPDASRPALWGLSHISFDQDLLELLPYVLELHGPGSRLSVMRHPSTRAARQAKRDSGIFYTPADVAEYMASTVLCGRHGNLRCLDPSCGTGVYLVALLEQVASRLENKVFDRFAFATRSLYGLDISTLAIESCAFLLLHNCLADTKAMAPWSAWHSIRLNLTATDALRLRPAPSGVSAFADPAQIREGLRQQLAGNSFIAPVEEKLRTHDTGSLFRDVDDHFPPLGAVFPEAELGFDVLVGNPPYAALGSRDDSLILEREYKSLGGVLSGSDLYPLFVEMMWRLTRQGQATSALVVPLSIAYHQGQQFRACRLAMAANGGRWRLAFFDREPHALFGEDVKTRNAILIRSELAGDPPRGRQPSWRPARCESGPAAPETSYSRQLPLPDCPACPSPPASQNSTAAIRPTCSPSSRAVPITCALFARGTGPAGPTKARWSRRVHGYSSPALPTISSMFFGLSHSTAASFR